MKSISDERPANEKSTERTRFISRYFTNTRIRHSVRLLQFGALPPHRADAAHNALHNGVEVSRVHARAVEQMDR